jgi:hypothetical protein
MSCCRWLPARVILSGCEPLEKKCVSHRFMSVCVIHVRQEGIHMQRASSRARSRPCHPFDACVQLRQRDGRHASPRRLCSALSTLVPASAPRAVSSSWAKLRSQRDRHHSPTSEAGSVTWKRCSGGRLQALGAFEMQGTQTLDDTPSRERQISRLKELIGVDEHTTIILLSCNISNSR